MFKFLKSTLFEEAGEVSSGGGGSEAAGQSALGGQSQASGASKETFASSTTSELIKLDGWKGHIPSDLSENKTLAQLPDTAEGLVNGLKSMVNAQALVGVDVMAQPRESWTQEQWNEHYDKSGRPENSEGYEVKKPEDWPEEIPIDGAKIKSWQDFFYEFGLNKQQGEAIISSYLSGALGDIKQHKENIQAQLDSDYAALEAEAGDNLPAILDKANAALIKTGGDGVLDVITKANLQNNPVITNWLAGINDMLADDRVIGNGSETAYSSEQSKALQQIESLKGDKAFQARFMNKREVGHKEAVAQMERLRRIAYPG